MSLQNSVGAGIEQAWRKSSPKRLTLACFETDDTGPPCAGGAGVVAVPISAGVWRQGADGHHHHGRHQQRRRRAHRPVAGARCLSSEYCSTLISWTAGAHQHRIGCCVCGGGAWASSAWLIAGSSGSHTPEALFLCTPSCQCCWHLHHICLGLGVQVTFPGTTTADDIDGDPSQGPRPSSTGVETLTTWSHEPLRALIFGLSFMCRCRSCSPQTSSFMCACRRQRQGSPAG